MTTPVFRLSINVLTVSNATRLLPFLLIKAGHSSEEISHYPIPPVQNSDSP